ncbi:MAG: hypothetical protein R3F56_14820 [Planctomycetota bacterium]
MSRAASAAIDLPRTLRTSTIEGCLFALMVGLGETYLVANGVALHATAIQLALLTAIPLLVGGLGPALVLWALRRGVSRRLLCTLGSVGQAAAVAWMAFDNLRGTLTVEELVGLSTVYQVCGQGVGTAWSSWFGDLVPAARRTTYFAARSRLMQLWNFAGLLAGGTCIAQLEGHLKGLGFGVSLALAAACRLVGALLMWRSPEPSAGPMARGRTVATFFLTQRGRTALTLLFGSAAFQAATYLSGPFYSPYMLAELHLSYFGYMLALGAQAVVKFATMRAWVRIVDRHSPKVAYGLGALLAALVPLPWLWLDGLPGVLCAQAFSGLAWAGYEVALFTVLMHCSRRSTRAQLFAAQTFGNALGQCGGSLLGGYRVASHGYLDVFAASAAARTAFGVGMVAVLAGLRFGFRRRFGLLLRVVGYRPGPGMVHRPIEEPTARPDETA